MSLYKILSIAASISFPLLYVTLDDYSKLNSQNILHVFFMLTPFYTLSLLEHLYARAGEYKSYKTNMHNCMMNKLPFVILFILINYQSLIFVSVIYGLIFSVMIYFKGFFNNKNSKCFINDFYYGMKNNSKVEIFQEENLDLKIFLVNHIGFPLWLLLNLRNTIFGIANGTYIPLIITTLQSIYIIFWSLNEKWLIVIMEKYYSKIGFNLCYGSFALVPAIFCNYTYYTSINIVQHNYLLLSIYIFIYLLGLHIFICSSIEKYSFKKSLNPQEKYISLNCKDHICRFLVDENSWWYYSRYINYLGELLMVLSLSLICGFSSIIPHVYTILIIYTLFDRIRYNERKNEIRFSEDWKLYKKYVPYVLIPYVY